MPAKHWAVLVTCFLMLHCRSSSKPRKRVQQVRQISGMLGVVKLKLSAWVQYSVYQLLTVSKASLSSVYIFIQLYWMQRELNGSKEYAIYIKSSLTIYMLFYMLYINVIFDKSMHVTTLMLKKCESINAIKQSCFLISKIAPCSQIL